MSGIITELFVRRNNGTKSGTVSHNCRHEPLYFYTTSSPPLSILSWKQNVIEISRSRILQMTVLAPGLNCKRFFTTKSRDKTRSLYVYESVSKSSQWSSPFVRPQFLSVCYLLADSIYNHGGLFSTQWKLNCSLISMCLSRGYSG